MRARSRRSSMACFEKLLFAQALHRLAFGRRRRQAERHLFLEDQGECRADVFAQGIACGAGPVQPAIRFSRKPDGDGNTRGFAFASRERESKAEQVFAELDVFLRSKFHFAPGAEQLLSVAAEQSERLRVRQPRELVEKG